MDVTEMLSSFDPLNSSNATTEHSRKYQHSVFEIYPPALLNFAVGACIVFTIIGIPGNLITISALLRSPKLRNATTTLIVNLCISDISYCCTSVILTASSFLGHRWVEQETLCMLLPVLHYSTAMVSLFTISAVTINRCVLICHPNLYRYMYSKGPMVLMILLLWVCAFGIFMPSAFQIWGRFGYSPDVGFCTILPLNGKSPKSLIFLVIMGVPIFFFILCYARVFMVVRKAKKNVRKYSMKLITKDMRLLKMILVIFLTFMACFVPLSLIKILKKEGEFPVVNILGHLGVFASACTNPLIYVVMSRQYRKAYISLFKSISCRMNRYPKQQHTPISSLPWNT